MGTNAIIIFILLLGSAIGGFIAAWLIRQKLVDKLTKLILSVENEKEEKSEISNQYETDRQLLQEEVQQYKEKYNTQLTKNQRLSENLRKSQADVDQLQEKVSNLTEMSIESQEEISQLKKQLTEIPSPQTSVRITPSRKIKEKLSLLDKSVRY